MYFTPGNETWVYLTRREKKVVLLFFFIYCHSRCCPWPAHIPQSHPKDYLQLCLQFPYMSLASDLCVCESVCLSVSVSQVYSCTVGWGGVRSAWSKPQPIRDSGYGNSSHLPEVWSSQSLMGPPRTLTQSPRAVPLPLHTRFAGIPPSLSHLPLPRYAALDHLPNKPPASESLPQPLLGEEPK